MTQVAGKERRQKQHSHACGCQTCLTCCEAGVRDTVEYARRSSASQKDAISTVYVGVEESEMTVIHCKESSWKES